MEGKLPLNGVRVIDLTRVYSGPYCTFLLAQAGAEVIKIEPTKGESVRQRTGTAGAALPFALLNANKRMVTLDLKSETGRDVLDRLLENADVLVENFRPGVLERLGLAPERLKRDFPRLVVARASGYGQNGPYRDYPAMDLTIQAVCGVMDSTGFPDQPPVKSGPALADFIAGTHLFGAICAALYSRDRTGEGLTADVAMMDTAVPTLMSNIAMAWGMRDDDRYVARTGNRHGGMNLAPYNVYPARDGYVAIISTSDRHWEATAAALGLDHLLIDPRFATMRARVEHMDALDAEIGASTREVDRADLFERLNTSGAVCAPVRKLTEVLDDPHLLQRGMLAPISHPEYGEIVIMRSPIRFNGVPMPEYRASGRLGADTEAVLAEAGFDSADMAEFRRNGVI